MTDIVLKILVGFGLALSAAPAAAQETFTPPEGCTAFLTVQSRSCTVSHYWTCSADPQGTHWRLTLDQEGPAGLSFSDAQFRWLLSFDLRGGMTSTLVEPEEDPASLDELFETGTDTMAFATLTTGQGLPTLRRTYSGFDRLIGETVVIDGQELERTAFRYEYDLGFGPRVVEGNQYVSRELRLFFGGEEIITTPDGATMEVNVAPVDFMEPGEAGFLAIDPLYDCGDMMSALPSPETFN